MHRQMSACGLHLYTRTHSCREPRLFATLCKRNHTCMKPSSFRQNVPRPHLTVLVDWVKTKKHNAYFKKKKRSLLAYSVTIIYVHSTTEPKSLIKETQTQTQKIYCFQVLKTSNNTAGTHTQTQTRVRSHAHAHTHKHTYTHTKRDRLTDIQTDR